MPEGHSVHRIARQFALHFVGKRIAATSPQGRFAAGAAEIDGQVMTEAKAVGKQMFLGFENDLWLRVHLGIYGAWDFAGDITVDAGIASRASASVSGTVVGEYEDSLGSIGAPRRTRLRMSEQEVLGDPLESFPPEPIGQVRVRLLTEAGPTPGATAAGSDASRSDVAAVQLGTVTDDGAFPSAVRAMGTVADLRGPTVCEVIHPEQVAAVIASLGPDPLVHKGKSAEDAFVAKVLKKPTPIGLLLMDQSVVSGIGNVYRAEMLFRARLNPHTPGKLVPEETARALWKDWAKLLKIGVETGQMLTMEGLGKKAQAAALASREDRHWVYKREGLECRVCGTHITMEMAASRKLYWCSQCQA